MPVSVPIKICAPLCLSICLASTALTTPAANSANRIITGSVAGQAKGTNGALKQDNAPASATLKRGLKSLSKRNMKGALSAYRQLKSGSLERKVMAWAIAMDGRDLDPATLSNMSKGLSYWPGGKAMRRNMERSLVKNLEPEPLRAAFSQARPESDEAIIALARAQKAAGQTTAARKTIVALWTTKRLDAAKERLILKHLSSVFTRSDHRARVEYLLSKKRLRAAGRIAGKAGASRLVAARTAVERKQRSARSKLANVPVSQKSDPNYLLSKARHQRRGKKYKSAAKNTAFS